MIHIDKFNIGNIISIFSIESSLISTKDPTQDDRDSTTEMNNRLISSNYNFFRCNKCLDMSMDIHGKSVDMDMNGKFHIHGKRGRYAQALTMSFLRLPTSMTLNDF